MKNFLLLVIGFLFWCPINNTSAEKMGIEDLFMLEELPQLEAQTEKDLKDIAPYPLAEEGMNRYVIFLPEKENEQLLQVELIIGKTIVVDCNYYWFGGELEEKSLEGWGYRYYVMSTIHGPASTKMGCPPGSEREEFVKTNLGKSAFLRYNSKLPIVVYVPEGVEAKYRIWEAQKK